MWYDRSSIKNHIQSNVRRLDRYIWEFKLYENKIIENPNSRYWVYWSNSAQYNIWSHSCIRNLLTDLKYML